MHTEGMRALARDGRIPFRLRVYNGSGEGSKPDLIFQNGIDDHIRCLLRTTIVETFRAVALPAALVQSDAWQVDGHKFAAYFGLPDTLSEEEYIAEYERILTDKYEGTAENLPQGIIRNTIITAIKGPLVMPLAIFTSYEKNKDGAVESIETNERTEGTLDILPDWWKTLVN